MISIRMIKTGEVRSVTPNEAHGLIERGIAELAKRKRTKMMRPSKKSGYKIKGGDNE